MPEKLVNILGLEAYLKNISIVIFTILVFFLLYQEVKDFIVIDQCLDKGGAWLDQWERCTFSYDEIKQYCKTLDLVEFEKFHCGARLDL